MIRWMRRLHTDDRGGITIFYAVLIPSFLALLGLVLDYGGQIRALQRADNIAAEAARAAGQGINAGQAIAGGKKVIDRAAASTAAQQYLNALPDATGTVQVIDDVHLRVNVTVRFNPVLIDLYENLLEALQENVRINVAVIAPEDDDHSPLVDAVIAGDAEAAAAEAAGFLDALIAVVMLAVAVAPRSS